VARTCDALIFSSVPIRVLCDSGIVIFLFSPRFITQGNTSFAALLTELMLGNVFRGRNPDTKPLRQDPALGVPQAHLIIHVQERIE